jgi:hypothetical protein
VDVIRSRMIGQYENGLGKSWSDKNLMKFYNDGQVNYPYLSDGMWFLTQHRRWGLLKQDVDYLAVAKAINQTELYKQAAAQVGVPVPKVRLPHLQAHRRRRLGRQGPEEIRRQLQGSRLTGCGRPGRPRRRCPRFAGERHRRY